MTTLSFDEISMVDGGKLSTAEEIGIFAAGIGIGVTLALGGGAIIVAIALAA